METNVNNTTEPQHDAKLPVSGSYVVFEDSHEHEALIQLSVTLPTLERAREYVKGWKSKKLYIYLLVE
jgi:hypothetical protein